MEKKYNLPEENTENNEVSEPAIAYRRTHSNTGQEEIAFQVPNRPGIFTDEEKLNRIDESIKEMEAGIYLTHEEVLDLLYVKSCKDG